MRSQPNSERPQETHETHAGQRKSLCIVRRMRASAVGLLALLLGSCAGSSTTTLPSTIPPSVEPSAQRAPIVGEWVGTHECEWIVQALTGFDRALVVDSVVGNGLIPGVSDNAELMDAHDLCADAVERQHSHFFTASGRFGSRDFNGQQVDDGTYGVIDDDTIRIEGKEFGYAIHGDELTLMAMIPEGCTSEDCAWQIMVAMNSQPLRRGRPDPS